MAQDLTEDEETVEDSIIEDEDDEAEVEEDEPTDLVSALTCLTHEWTVARAYPFIDGLGVEILLESQYWDPNALKLGEQGQSLRMARKCFLAQVGSREIKNNSE